MSNLAEGYLRDLGTLLKLEALEARSKAKAARGTPDYDYESGRAFAYYEVVSLMMEQAVAFQLPQAMLGLDGLDPNNDLLS